MPGEVDKLQVRIDANADKAFKAIESLISRLNEFNRMSGKSVGALINLNAKLEELRTNTNSIRNIRNPLRSFNEGAQRTRDSVSEAVEPTKRLSDNMKRLDKFASTTGTVLKTVAKGGFTLLGKAVHATVGRLQKFLHSIVRIAGYRAIRSALRFITQGFSQGIENLYLWSQAYNTTFAPTMDRFASSMLYLKNGFAAMFSPLIEYFMPYIELLVDKLVDAFNWVQRLFAELTGRNTWNRAVKVQTQYKEATDGTAKSVKALREQIQLMDFDELNNLTDSGDRGSGGAGDVLNPDPREMFVLEKTAVEGMKGTFWENVKTKLTGWLEDQGLWDENGFNWHHLGEIVGGAIHDLWELFSDWFAKIKWDEVFKALTDFIDGLLKGLFPEKYNARQNEKTVVELVNEASALIHEVNGDKNWSSREEAGSAKLEREYAQLSADVTKLEEERSKLSRFANEMFRGLPSDVQESWKTNYADYQKGGDVGEREFRDNANFRAYVEALEGVKYLEDTITDLHNTQGNIAKAYYGIADEAGRRVGEKVLDLNRADGYGRVFGEGASRKFKEAVSSWISSLNIKVNFQNPFSYGTKSRLIEGYAAGGYPSRGSMFYAGETGAELVGNINGRTGVASSAEITGIGDAVWSTGNLTNSLLSELITLVKNKDLTISPSASLGKVVARSQKLYATQTG